MHLGLIGYPLSHSFSPAYFNEKFEKLGIKDATYKLFPLENITDFPNFILNNKNLTGFNVTIPHKQNIIPYLDELDISAQNVGAVNVVKILKNHTLRGYNTDVYGFMQTIAKYLENDFLKSYPKKNHKAMILGEGGASKAVKSVFLEKNIPFDTISRRENSSNYRYENITQDFLAEFSFIVNTTPLGMYPNIEQAPLLPYNHLENTHILIDLVYNPKETLFLRYGKEKNAFTENGLTMLYAQAEKAWKIWQNDL